MIKLSNLNKYFNHRRKNEIHVIKDINLELPNTGMVSLLGPSGSGKTTLLNVIGGLDKANSGIIDIDNKVISKYNDSQWNKYRNSKFGYIFQNYLLIPDISVYDNLDFVLMSFELTLEERKERIEYALLAVGMEKYSKRKPTQLSGGQQQRVSIARALVKSPDVYIADEPTGNIDEKNTTIIMNILKKISQKSLVILVTHETNIANFYSDRIIEIKDGKVIKDSLNDNFDLLGKHDDRNIYLQEYVKHEEDLNDINIKYFYNDKSSDPLRLNIIFEDGVYYIHADNNMKIKYIDQANEIKIIDSKKPVIEKTSIEDFKYDLPKIESDSKKPRSMLRPKDTVKMAYKAVLSLKLIQKIMFVIFFFSAIFITLGLALYNSSGQIDESLFLDYNRNTILVDSRDINSLEDINKLKQNSSTDIILTEQRHTYIDGLNISEFSQRHLFFRLNNKAAIPLSIVSDIDIVLGRLPETPYELLIDLYLVEELLRDNDFRSTGVKTKEQFIGLTHDQRSERYEIVGIINNNNPNFYLTDEGYKLLALNNLIKYMKMPLFDSYVLYNDVDIEYTLYDKNIERTKLIDLDLGEKEVIVSSSVLEQIPNNGRQFEMNGHIFTAVGFYNFRDDNRRTIYIQRHHLDLMYEIVLLDKTELCIIDSNKEIVKESLLLNEYEIVDLYQYDYDNNVILEYDANIIIYIAIVLLLNIVFIYFIMRSSASSRMYKIGVYRALGVSKLSVINIFILEILFITLLSSIVGIVLLTIAILQLNVSIISIYYPMYIPLISIGVILMINILVGIMPIVMIVRKTPAQILNRSDL